MNQKLAGYKQAQELVKLYRQVGFSDEEIAEELTIMENLLLAEVIEEVEKRMSDEEKKKFDEFLKKKPEPEEIAQFLKLDKEKINQKIETRLQESTDQLKKDLVESELSLEKLKARIRQKVS